MEPEELLSLITLGAVAPYALEAIFRKFSTRNFRSIIGAYAPTWSRLQKHGTHAA